LYIGGGTPSLLTEQNIKYLSSILREHLPELINTAIEITMECEPGTLSKSKIESIIEHINPHRVSLGGQSLHQASLEIMGRGHNIDDFYQAVNIFNSFKNQKEKNINLHSINTDMILGLPYEGLKEVLYTAEKMVGLDVDHISAYMLEIESGTNFAKRYQEFEGPLPNEEELENIYTKTHDFLINEGFGRYSFASFAKNH
jgi:oxygen-independent coproporphyrinogen-3 oxidase